MKTRKKNQLGLWVMVVSVFFLLAAPLARAGDYDGGTYDVTTDETYLNIGLTTPGTTVNLYANISDYILVGSGSFLNVYSGNVGMYIAVSPGGVVTVYGTDFDGYNVPDEVVFPYGNGILKGHYGNGSSVQLWFLTNNNTIIYLQLPPVSDDGVIIDIKPGSDENVINLNSNGVVPVAVLTTSDFDADSIDPDSVLFAGASPLRSTLEDVDNDGDVDKLFHFRTQELNLDENSKEATLTGSIKSAVTRSSAVATGNTIQATDKVQIKSSKKK